MVGEGRYQGGVGLKVSCTVSGKVALVVGHRW